MIDADRITKRFERKTVLDRLSLSVAKGELFALLGPNGAGKTTLIKCLAGLYVPLAGTITIDGLDRYRDHLEIRRFTAWLADQPFVYPRLSGRDWLRMIADLYEVDRARRDAQIEALLDAFDLVEVGAEPVGYYSNGQHKKIAVCGVLVSNARLLLLDEPFAGEIDPPGAAALREILRDLSTRHGVTTVLTTQIVDQAQRLADRVGILVDGRLADVGEPDEVCERHGVGSLEEVLTVLHSRGPGSGARGFLDTLG